MPEVHLKRENDISNASSLIFQRLKQYFVNVKVSKHWKRRLYASHVKGCGIFLSW